MSAPESIPQDGSEDTCTRLLDTPVGKLVLVATSTAMKRSEFLKDANTPAKRAESNGPASARRILDQAATELGEYFAGRRQQFQVPMEPEGTDFQRRVWQALLEIPYGELRSYGSLAERAGADRSAARPVGGAVGRNPIPIIVPCHRVVGRDRRLTGFSCGLPFKVFLLDREGIALDRVDDRATVCSPRRRVTAEVGA